MFLCSFLSYLTLLIPNPEDNPSTPDSTQAIQSARADLLSATALHHLRQTVTTNVLITNPILKAVHTSTLASPIEQDLPPWIAARDSAAQAAAEQTTALRQTLDALSQVEADARRAAVRNRELATEVLRLAAAAAGEREVFDGEEEEEQGQNRARIVELERQLATSRYRWRVFKGAASGIVAGSGVEWAEDEELAAVVLDPE